MKTYFNGMILLASPLDPERVLPYAEAVFGTKARVTDRLPDGFCLWLKGESGYAQNAVQDFLCLIAPYTRYGDICFCPEQGEHFRWFFSNATRIWQKQSGIVLYERAGVPLCETKPDTAEETGHDA